MSDTQSEPTSYTLSPDGTLRLPCDLPPSARTGDTLAISATREESREADGYGEYTLTEKDLLHKSLELTVTWPLDRAHLSDTYVIQLGLHGRHGVIKESCLFEAYIDVSALSQPKLSAASFKTTLFTSLLGGLVGLLVKSDL